MTTLTTVSVEVKVWLGIELVLPFVFPVIVEGPEDDHVKVAPLGVELRLIKVVGPPEQMD